MECLDTYVDEFLALRFDIRTLRDPFGNTGGRKISTWSSGSYSSQAATLYAYWDEADGMTCPYGLEPLMKPKVDPTAAPEILKGIGAASG